MQQFIDPRTLARIKNMPLIARSVAEGFLHGIHNSMQRGVGIEFSQYRVYEPGDDPSKVDWKLFARSDRYFVREAERESELNIWLILDASASMSQISQHSAQHGGWNKLDYGRHLIATLSYLAQRQGDAVGYSGLSTQECCFLPYGTGDKHWQQILLSLSRMQTGKVFPTTNIISKQLLGLQKQHKKAGLIIFISDFYQKNNEIFDFLCNISIRNTDITALQLQCDDEKLFRYKGAVRFQDLETHESILVSAGSTRTLYLEALRKHQQQLKSQLAKMNINLQTVNIDQPLDKVMFEFLRQRQKVKC